MSRSAIRKLSEELKRLEGKISPKIETRVTITYDDDPEYYAARRPGVVYLAFE